MPGPKGYESKKEKQANSMILDVTSDSYGDIGASKLGGLRQSPENLLSVMMKGSELKSA